MAEVTATTADGMVVELMIEGTHTSHVNCETEKRTVADFIAEQPDIRENATIMVNNVLANPNTRLTPGANGAPCQITVTQGGKTGGVRTNHTPTTTGYDMPIQIKTRTNKKSGVHTFVIEDHIQLPEKMYRGNRTPKYPFHMLKAPVRGIKQSFAVPIKARSRVAAAMRNHIKVTGTQLVGRTVPVLDSVGNSTTRLEFRVWRVA